MIERSCCRICGGEFREQQELIEYVYPRCSTGEEYEKTRTRCTCVVCGHQWWSDTLRGRV